MIFFLRIMRGAFHSHLRCEINGKTPFFRFESKTVSLRFA
jgi:hypothetical protein